MTFVKKRKKEKNIYLYYTLQKAVSVSLIKRLTVCTLALISGVSQTKLTYVPLKTSFKNSFKDYSLRNVTFKKI